MKLLKKGAKSKAVNLYNEIYRKILDYKNREKEEAKPPKSQVNSEKCFHNDKVSRYN
jgi:hypothetical protein